MSDYQKASLAGRRFVTSSEVSRRGHINEELIKSLTGGDTINARHIYGRPFKFKPSCKIFLRVNHKPVIRDQSHAMWRRVKLVSFLEQFAVDPKFGERFISEAPGILNWAIRGCLDWQRDGLGHPSVVETGTKGYQKESDLLVQFFEECCVLEEGAKTGGADLYFAYQGWCDETKLQMEDRLSKKFFGIEMKKRLEWQQTGGKKKPVFYLGVRVERGHIEF